ncbi:MAG: hypothetical protein KJ887_04780 [Candidatus Omnitrophica bacterium]|nr:hypothetical protein [Candidatus Omnitrophota bacterium]MBU1047630.1 hypothetical protein [Candidatus Omnitrophota bacterium]MBU1888992.1 hypothetical protein [Candidatus Omnitrophota bacterium]
MISEKDIKRISRLKQGLKWFKPFCVLFYFLCLFTIATRIYDIYDIANCKRLSKESIFYLIKIGVSGATSLPPDYSFQNYELLIFSLTGEIILFLIIIITFSVIFWTTLSVNKFALHLWDHIKEIESKDKETN